MIGSLVVLAAGMAATLFGVWAILWNRPDAGLAAIVAAFGGVLLWTAGAEMAERSWGKRRQLQRALEKVKRDRERYGPNPHTWPGGTRGKARGELRRAVWTDLRLGAVEENGHASHEASRRLTRETRADMACLSLAPKGRRTLRTRLHWWGTFKL